MSGRMNRFWAEKRGSVFADGVRSLLRKRKGRTQAAISFSA